MQPASVLHLHNGPQAVELLFAARTLRARCSTRRSSRISGGLLIVSYAPRSTACAGELAIIVVP